MTELEVRATPLNDANATPSSFMALSLLQVRAFLFEQGMMIVPWASTREVLDELHLVLQTHTADDAFWQSLRGLLRNLNLDLQRSLPDNDRPNEVLAFATREALLDEIRCCLSAEPTESSGFASLLRRITDACLPLLLLLAGATAVSCGARAEDNRQAVADAAGGVSAAGGTSATGGNSTHATGGDSSYQVPPTTGGNPSVNPNGTVPCAKSWDAGGPLTLSDMHSIANQCIASSELRDYVNACLDTLNASWQQGIAGMLNCGDCSRAVDTFGMLASRCSGLPDRFDRCVIDQRWCLPVYMGVRMG